jgi:hypothetical protein
MAADHPQTRDAYLADHLNRLDEMERIARDIAHRDHPLIRDGEVVTDPATGETVNDPRPAREAERLLARFRRDRDRLTGLRALPTTTDHDGPGHSPSS